MSPQTTQTEKPFKKASIEDFRFRKSPDQMTPDELCEEAARLREHISQSAEKLAGLYMLLYSNIRRRPADDLTSAYLTVANSGKRLAGMVVQGIRRAGSFDRVLVASKQEVTDRLHREKEAQVRKELAEEKKVKRAQVERDRLLALYGPEFDPMNPQLFDGSSSSDLDDLYGEGA